MLDARALEKSYGPRRVVQQVSLQLPAGRITGLLGPNGAGKSTTVAMLAGLLQPDAGTLVLSPGAASPAAYRARIGLVPQDLALYEDLPARANLALFGALYGLRGALLQQRIQQALALVGLAERAQDKPATFSGGMKRRLNIACALVHDPDILLFDEPTVGVDPQSRNAIFDNLEALRDRGKALLYTTHYMEEAERLCDTVVVMDQGRVVAQGDQATLLATLPAAQALTLSLAAHSPPPQLDALQALPGVRTVTLAQQTLSVALASPQALTAASAAVLAALAAQGCAVSQLATRRATLEDVFLALTGRQLRDQ